MRLLLRPMFPYIITRTQPTDNSRPSSLKDVTRLPFFPTLVTIYAASATRKREREREKKVLYDTHRCANAVDHFRDKCRSPTISPSDYTQHYTQLISWLLFFCARRLYDV